MIVTEHGDFGDLNDKVSDAKPSLRAARRVTECIPRWESGNEPGEATRSVIRIHDLHTTGFIEEELRD